MELLFPEPPEESGSPMRRSESNVNWLRRSSQVQAQQARRLLNRWLEPLADDTDLLSRIAGDDESFHGAFLEVYLAASFRQANWNFERAPELMGRKGFLERPDYAVHAGSNKCYFEAVTTNPKSHNPGPQRRLDQLLDRIDQLECPDFSLIVTPEAVGSSDAPAGSIGRELTQWLATLDPDHPHEYDDLPTYRYDRDGWSLLFEAAATAAPYRGQPGRTIGLQMNAAESIADDASLTRALLSKAGKYKDLEAPYVIAADEDSWETSAGGNGGIEPMAWHRTNTLYGSSAVATSGPNIGSHVRQPNGFWRRSNSYANVRVSAVLLTDHLGPWNALSIRPEMWINPMATYPAVPLLPLWRRVRFGWVEEGTKEQYNVTDTPVSPAEFWADHE